MTDRVGVPLADPKFAASPNNGVPRQGAATPVLPTDERPVVVPVLARLERPTDDRFEVERPEEEVPVLRVTVAAVVDRVRGAVVFREDEDAPPVAPALGPLEPAEAEAAPVVVAVPRLPALALPAEVEAVPVLPPEVKLAVIVPPAEVVAGPPPAEDEDMPEVLDVGVDEAPPAVELLEREGAAVEELLRREPERADAEPVVKEEAPMPDDPPDTATEMAPAPAAVVPDVGAEPTPILAVGL